MNSRIRLSTWSPGLNKIRLTKLIREEAAIPLNVAHELVNRLLAGESVDVEFASEICAHRVAQDIRDLGVGAECIDTEIPVH